MGLLDWLKGKKSDELSRDELDKLMKPFTDLVDDQNIRLELLLKAMDEMHNAIQMFFAINPKKDKIIEILLEKVHRGEGMDEKLRLKLISDHDQLSREFEEVGNFLLRGEEYYRLFMETFNESRKYRQSGSI